LKELLYQIEIAGETKNMTKMALLIPKLDEQFEVLKKKLAPEITGKRLGAFNENINC
jgi:hypothetical protein